jgi:hypothetical protein
VNTETSQVDDLRLVAVQSAVSCAALFVRFTVAEWSLPSMLDDVLRIVGHRVSAIVDHSDPRVPGFITLRLGLRGDCFIVEVQDDLNGELSAGSALRGVKTVVVPLAGRGNLMRSELALPTGLSAQEVSLPRRGSRRSLVDEQFDGAQGPVEPAVLQRVLSSLTQWSPEG